MTDVWVACCVLPSHNKAQIDVYDNKKAAEKAVEWVRENHPESVDTVWVESKQIEIESEFTLGDDNGSN